MKRSEAAKYARWSATAALFLATLTAGVYLERKWVAHREKEKAPPPAPRDVSQLMNGITFSKVEGNQKIFTVEAQRATDFRDKSTSLMEDVSITIFGKTGERNDTIHTQSCQYEKDGGSIVCSGEVQLDLQSATDAERAKKSSGTKAAQKVHVETRGVTFNRATGLAQSDQRVKFVFPNGRGEAIGVEYRSEDGAITLLRDVSFFLLPSATSAGQPASGTNPPDPVHVTGKSVDFGRDSRLLRLRGPVEAQTGTARMAAGELTLALDKTFHAEKLVATRGANAKNPELESRGKDSQTDLSGETLTAYFAPEGWLTRIEGAGGVQGSQRSATDSDDFSAETASLELRPRVNEPRDLNLKGNVQLKTAGKTGESRTLQTDALVVEFAEREKGQSSKLVRAETQARSTLEWTEPAPQAALPATAAEIGSSRTSLTADRLVLEF